MDARLHNEGLPELPSGDRVAHATLAGQVEHKPRGVCWSGMDDARPWPRSPELQAQLDALYAASVAKSEARIAAYAAEHGLDISKGSA